MYAEIYNFFAGKQTRDISGSINVALIAQATNTLQVKIVTDEELMKIVRNAITLYVYVYSVQVHIYLDSQA